MSVSTKSRTAPRIYRINTGWRPHSIAQEAILQAPEQIIDVTCGRRFGKSDVAAPWGLGLYEGATDGALVIPRSRTVYVAPTLAPNCLEFYEKVKTECHALVVKHNDTRLRLDFFNGSTLQCKSAERPDNLRGGAAFHKLLLDEKQNMDEEVWTKILAPMLADPPDRFHADGRPVLRRVMRMGTARGRKHWTFAAHMRSLAAPRGPGGKTAFQYPTWVRPGTEAYVEESRATLPANVFRQEIGAEFLEDAASYFQRIVYDGAPPPVAPEPGAVYTAGVDLAHTEDWSVVVVVRAKPRPMRVVHVERFGRLPWPLTKAKVVDVLRRWNADALIDCTPGGAPGDVIVEAFGPEWKRISGFDFKTSGGAGREDMLANLALSLEQDELTLPGTDREPAYPILAAELSGFAYEILPSGRARATAGPNLCDDTVMGLGLAAWLGKRTRNPYGSRKTL